MPLLRGWADYLIASLPDPGNQLCTDDFEVATCLPASLLLAADSVMLIGVIRVQGPSPHNVNLAAKGACCCNCNLLACQLDQPRVHSLNLLTMVFFVL